MKTLVLCTWFDGGPDMEMFSFKVLDTHFNEVEIPQYEYPVILDLYREESRDEECNVFWSSYNDGIPERYRAFVCEEVLEDAKLYNEAWNAWRQYTDKYDKILPEGWCYTYNKNYDEEHAKESLRLWEIANNLENALEEKYYGKSLGSYVEHHIGINEFCKLNNIDKVIRL